MTRGASKLWTATRPSQLRTRQTTIGEATALAITGDASAIHIVRSEKRPHGSCERPSMYATAEAGLTGRGLAAAELAAFKNHSSLSAECPAYMYVFHNSKEISRRWIHRGCRDSGPRHCWRLHRGRNIGTRVRGELLVSCGGQQPAFAGRCVRPVEAVVFLRNPASREQAFDGRAIRPRGSRASGPQMRCPATAG
jgi:hypothetical protein